MNKPFDLLRNKIVAPAYSFYNKHLSKASIGNNCKKIANFIFVHSKETALIMLVFNSVSILSSHISQIGGLKRSKRENKDYLITQEKKELGLDLLFTVIPPFFINNFIMKKLDSGSWTTKSALKNMRDIIAPTVGVHQDELYHTDHIRPVKETVTSLVEQVVSSLKKSKFIPKAAHDSFENFDNKLKLKLPDPVIKTRPLTIENITSDFDVIRKGQFKKFYNGRALDEINGQRNGLLIMATLGYTIIASNIIMPILKNKLANKEYEKKLKLSGETPESIKRKQRFEFNKYPPLNENSGNIFDIFTGENNSASSLNLSNTKNTITDTKNNNIFSQFNAYNTNTSQLTKLRI